jgi:hypothetical protein
MRRFMTSATLSSTSTLSITSILAATIGLASFGSLAGAQQETRPIPPLRQPGREPAQPSAGDIDLRPKWERGQAIRYRMTQDSTSAMPDMADAKKTTSVRNRQTVDFTLRVKDVNKETGVATVDMVYDALKIKLDGAGFDIDFDSSKSKPAATPKAPAPGKGKPSANPADADPMETIKQLQEGLAGLDPAKLIGEQFQKMVGTTLTLTIDKSGVITNVAGGSELDPTGLLGQMGAAAPGSNAPQAGGGLFGPITTADGGYTGLVRVGQKWTHTDSMSVGPLGAMRMLTEHTLRSAGRGTAEVAFAGRIDPQSAAGNASAQLKSATQSGSYTWDTAKGQLLRMNMEQRVVQSQPGTNSGADATSSTTMTVERR